MKQGRSSSTRKLTFTALFAAIAAILMFFEFPLPFMPPFLKVDLSGTVILIGALVLGAVPAIFIALIKDLIHLFTTQTGGVGELADFLITLTLVLVTYFIFKKIKGHKGAIIGCTLGTVAMAVTGVITNKFLLIPFYSNIMPIDAIISACAKVNPFIGNLNTYLIAGVLPFNIIKGTIISIITVLLYRKMEAFINNENQKFN